MNWDHSVIFEIALKYSISDSCWLSGLLYIYSKGFLPTVLDIMVIWVIHPFQSILVDWFLKCRCPLLPSPVWPLPIYLDSWTWHSRFLCNIVLYSIGLYFYHQTRPQLSVISTLAQLPHSFCSFISNCPLLFPSSILDTFWPGRLIFWCLIILPFLNAHEGMVARILE